MRRQRIDVEHGVEVSHVGSGADEAHPIGLGLFDGGTIHCSGLCRVIGSDDDEDTGFVAQPRRSLRALHALTQRNTAEYAVRPFLIHHRDLTMATLTDWVDDPSPHVRRLVSEGTRPRLPWGVQLKHLVEDPRPCLPLLLRLMDDPSEYVRRSVANHLNDVSKDHPDVVVGWLQEHLPGATPTREATLRHAARTLVKQGDKRALRAFGLGRAFRGDATLALRPRRARVGDAVEVAVTVTSGATRPQDLVADYVVHHVKQGGSSRAKTLDVTYYLTNILTSPL